MAKYHVSATVNGDDVEFLCDPEQTLLDVLRDELQLTGHQGRLRIGGLRCVQCHDRWQARLFVPGDGRGSR